MYEEYFNNKTIIEQTFYAIKSFGEKGGTNEQIFDAVVKKMNVPDECLEIPQGGQNGNRSKFKYRYDWAKYFLSHYPSEDNPYVFYNRATKTRCVNPIYKNYTYFSKLPLRAQDTNASFVDVYDWIPFYREFANVILSYENDRIELVHKLSNICKKLQLHWNVGPSNSNSGPKYIDITNELITTIDPLTIFAYLDFMSYSSRTREKICKEIKKEFSLKCKAPDDFEGIPMITYYQKRSFTWYGSLDYDKLIELSWNLFKTAITFDGEIGRDNKLEIYLNQAVKADNKWSSTSVTEILFAINPEYFLSLDIVNRKYIERHYPNQNLSFCKVSGDAKYFSASTYIDAVNELRIFLISDDNATSVTNLPELSVASFNEAKNSGDIDTSGSSDISDDSNEPEDDGPRGQNIIYYGIPGCGKSYAIKEQFNLKNESIRVERIVFHPDYTYSDFVGQLIPKRDEKDAEKVLYSFEPGPFTRILKNAVNNPEQSFYLIIEEINRGNAPAIFGDIFQLLDRNDNGESVFSIKNADIAEIVYGNSENEITIPKNLSIICTMNTADQNVFTLDTAFKRRWRMIYVYDKFEEGNALADKIIGNTNISWRKFHDVINEAIANEDRLITSEDKRLGAYFCSEEEISDINLFTDKVLKYLWDDVDKMNKKMFNNENVRTFDDIYRKKDSNADTLFDEIFNEDIVIKLKSDDGGQD